MASADQKKAAAIKAVQELFRDTSVSRSTTLELLKQVAEEIDMMVSAIDVSDEDD